MLVDFTKTTDIVKNGKSITELYKNGKLIWGSWLSVEYDTNWEKYADRFYFEAEEEGATVKMEKHGAAPDVSLEYSFDSEVWNNFIVGTTTVTLPNVGDKCYLRAKTENDGFGKIILGAEHYNNFILTKKIAAKGNIQYLLKSDGSRTDVSEYCYINMFKKCTSLTQAPALLATTLAEDCYYCMFYGCASLKISEDTEGGTIVLNLPTGTTKSNWNRAILEETNGSFKDDPQVGHTYRCY